MTWRSSTAVKDRLSLAFSPNVALIDVPAGVTGWTRPTKPRRQRRSVEAVEFRLRGRESIRFRGLVKVTGKEGWIEVKTDSKAGGADTRKVTIKASGG